MQALLERTKLVNLQDTKSGSYRITIPKRWLRKMGAKKELLMVFDEERKIIVLATPELLAKLLSEELKDFKTKPADIIELIRKASKSGD